MTVLVDSSVWIAYLRGDEGHDTDVLHALIADGEAAATDVVLLEVLAGTTDEERADRLARFLAGAELLRQESPVDAESAAAPYRACRRAGETPRSLDDCVVGRRGTAARCRRAAPRPGLRRPRPAHRAEDRARPAVTPATQRGHLPWTA